MAIIMLRSDWPGSFSRSVHKGGDKSAERTGGLQFDPGMHRVLQGDELASVARDVGKCLVVAALDDQFRARPDWDATDQVHAAPSLSEKIQLLEALPDGPGSAAPPAPEESDDEGVPVEKMTHDQLDELIRESVESGTPVVVEGKTKSDKIAALEKAGVIEPAE